MRYRLRLGCSRLTAAEAPSSLRSLIEETYSGSPSESSESEPISGGGMPASRRSLNTEKIGLPHRMKLLGHSSLGLGSMELFRGGWVRGTKPTKSMAVLNTVSSVLVCGSTEMSTNPLIYFLKKAPFVFVITVRIIVRITTGRVLARDHFPRPWLSAPARRIRFHMYLRAVCAASASAGAERFRACAARRHHIALGPVSRRVSGHGGARRARDDALLGALEQQVAFSSTSVPRASLPLRKDTLCGLEYRSVEITVSPVTFLVYDLGESVMHVFCHACLIFALKRVSFASRCFHLFDDFARRCFVLSPLPCRPPRECLITKQGYTSNWCQRQRLVAYHS